LFPLRDINPTRIRPVITWALILANVAVYFLVQQPGAGDVGSGDLPGDLQFRTRADEFVFQNAAIACEVTTGSPLEAAEIRSGRCSNSPTGTPVVFPDKNIWLSVGVSMFLHGSIAHILFNMWSLWIFGNNVEEAFGHGGYLLFYLAAGVAATLGFVLFNPELTVPLVGASGAIAGVMGAYLVLFPTHRILTIVVVFVTAVPAVVFLGFWLFSQFLIAGEQSGVAWEAHVVGFVFGMIVALPLRRRLLANTLAGAQAPAPF
jgi:membrane associated rhomboid family serine protease